MYVEGSDVYVLLSQNPRNFGSSVSCNRSIEDVASSDKNDIQLRAFRVMWCHDLVPYLEVHEPSSVVCKVGNAKI